MASHHVDPATLAAMDWRDVGAMLKVIDQAREKPAAATLDDEQAAAFRAQMAELAKVTGDG